MTLIGNIVAIHVASCEFLMAEDEIGFFPMNVWIRVKRFNETSGFHVWSKDEKFVIENQLFDSINDDDIVPFLDTIEPMIRC